MALKLVTAPVSYPLAVADVLKQLRLPSTYTAETDAFNWYIAAATAIAESKTNLCLLPQTWRLTLDRFPAIAILCAKGPLISVTSIQYIDVNGATQTFPSNQYIVDTERHPWRIVPAVNYSWPLTQNRINTVTVTFQSGYATAAAIPPEIMHGIRLIIGDMYAHRESVVIGRLVNEIPLNAERLFDLCRLDDHHTKSYL